MSKDKSKELKYEIFLIDQQIKDLKKQKKVYVDELREYEISKTNRRKYERK